MMKMNLQLFGGRGSSGGKRSAVGGGSITNEVHLGDEVTWNGKQYIVVGVYGINGEELTLQPANRFDPNWDWESERDKFHDVHIERWQLKR